MHALANLSTNILHMCATEQVNDTHTFANINEFFIRVRYWASE